MQKVELYNHSGVFKIYKYRAPLVIKSSHTSTRKGSYCLSFMEWEIRHSFTPVIIIFSTYGFIMAHCVEKVCCASNSWKWPWLIFNLCPWQNSPKCVVVDNALSGVSGKATEMGMERRMRSQGAGESKRVVLPVDPPPCSESSGRWALPWARRTMGREGSSWATSLAGLQPKACWEERSEHRELPLITRGNCKGILCFTQPPLKRGMRAM